MQKFKIDNFRNEYPESTFPEYRSLSDDEMLALRERLFFKFIPSKKPNTIELINNINFTAVFMDGVNASNDGFSLLNSIFLLNIMPDDYVYINWYRFDDIDVMKTHDLDKYFYNIWYPCSDDIDIFDKTFSWLLSIRHDGALSLSRPKNSNK
jgi:hypothetical protein